MKYCVNEAGINALRTLSVFIRERAQSLVIAANELMTAVADHTVMLGPHAKSLTQIAKDIQDTYRSAQEPVDNISWMLNNIADSYQEILEYNIFSETDESSAEIPSSGSSTTDSRHVKKLSKTDVNSSWKSSMKDINVKIDGYREELISRGVPEGEWLDNTLKIHKCKMQEQLGIDLNRASGHAENNMSDQDVYKYPLDYNKFYDDLADSYIKQHK